MKKIIKFLVRKVPRPWLIRFSYMFSGIVTLFYKGHNVHCTVCERDFRKFLPYGNKGLDNRLCPKCLSLERHRLMWLFFNQKTDLFKKPLKVLHIAPEQAFLKPFKNAENIDYVTADLLSPIADVKLDIRDMPLEDNSFDVVICNHVMEHIDEEQKALREVHRVLKDTGWAILQVPLDVTLTKTYEDPTIVSEAEREKAFGQYDHVRLYGTDYKDRLAKAGFRVNVDDFVKTLDPEMVKKIRVDDTEMIYQCFKK